MKTYQCFLIPTSLPELLISHPLSKALKAYDVISYHSLTSEQETRLKQLFETRVLLDELAEPHLLARQHHEALVHPREQSLGSFLKATPSFLRIEQWIVSQDIETLKELKNLLNYQWREPAIEDLWLGSLDQWKQNRLKVRTLERAPDPSWDYPKEPSSIGLEFSEDEIKAIRLEEQRRGQPLNRAEWELIAQTWSEHCKHKIFAAHIESVDTSQTLTQGLFKTHLQKPALEIQKHNAETYLSLFHDNSGVIALRNSQSQKTDWSFCLKMETHNSPSAISPYGGASTGLVGVQRDILGTGLGAKPIASWDVVCIEEPEHNQKRPTKALPPEVIRKGVLKGIEDGGNQSGIPTVQGSVVFHPSYSAKPLVYAGTIGILKKEHVAKKAQKGDTLFCVGGAVGPDGLRGAVMSSRDLRSEDFSGSAVQVAQPFVQRCLTEFLLEARDLGLITSSTDNGAGGLASSVGEMSQSTGGATIDLTHLRLKFEGLYAWERLLSESQERMTIATRQPEEFIKLAKSWDVEWDRLGELNNTGVFEVKCFDKTLVHMPLEFLHEACPRMHLKTNWTWKTEMQALHGEAQDFDAKNLQKVSPLEIFPKLLDSVHLTSREAIVRRFDHEVQGRTRRLPFAGQNEESPQDASSVEVFEAPQSYIALGHGLAPWRNDIHDNVIHSIDESIRQALLAGMKMSGAGFLDNFSWPDPLPHSERPQSERLLWKLVRSCEILSSATRALGIPFVSGKDSMKNNTEGIDVLETLVISVGGSASHPASLPSSFFTRANDVVFYLPPLKASLRGSSLERVCANLGLAKELSSQRTLFEADSIEKIDKETQELWSLLKTRYQQVESAVEQGLIRAAKDISEGGLITALFEMSLGRFLGLQFEDTQPQLEKLYSEGLGGFVMTCDVHAIEKFEKHFPELKRIGVVIKSPELRFDDKNTLSLRTLRQAYQQKGESSFWF